MSKSKAQEKLVHASRSQQFLETYKELSEFLAAAAPYLPYIISGGMMAASLGANAIMQKKTAARQEHQKIAASGMGDEHDAAVEKLKSMKRARLGITTDAVRKQQDTVRKIKNKALATHASMLAGAKPAAQREML
jgi:hypothetical protein